MTILHEERIDSVPNFDRPQVFAYAKSCVLVGDPHPFARSEQFHFDKLGLKVCNRRDYPSDV